MKNPVILQGGIETVLPGEILGELNFVAASDGNTLSKTPQPVPGGLLGVTAPKWWPQFLQNLFNETISNGFTGVNATVELAAPASSIELSLVKAPNTPITGNPGEFELKEGETLLVDKNNRLVDNSFSASGANGCGGLFALLVDPFVNSIVGFPSAAGSNTAILEGTNYVGERAAVIASEK